MSGGSWFQSPVWPSFLLNIFNIKTDGQKMARLVAQGFSQVEGIDFNKLFSPVVRFESVRTIFALATLHGWYMTSVGVHMAS